MQLVVVPRLSLCSSDIVAPDVAQRRSLLRSSFDFFHGSNFIPKRATRHRTVEEDTLPPISKPRRHQHQQQQLSQQCKWTVALCVGTDLWPQKPKKVTKTQKKFYFRPDIQSRWTLQVRWPLGLEIPLDSKRGCCVPPIKTFFIGGTQHPLIQTTTQAFKEEKRKDDPSRHFWRPRRDVGNAALMWTSKACEVMKFAASCGKGSMGAMPNGDAKLFCW